MPGYSLALQAEIDLTEILEYIAADSPEAALAMYASFLACFDFISKSPKGGRSRDDLETGLRSHPKGSYIVFYRIAKQNVEIARVLHAARDIDAIFS